MTALPDGWSTATLDELNDPQRAICYGILKPGPDLDGGVPYVKVKNIRGERIDVSNLNRTSPEIESKYRRSRLRAGDLLISIRGTYGRVAPVPLQLESANITQDSARIAPVGVQADYLQKYLQGPSAQRFFAEVARGVAVKGVNIGDLRQTPVLVPPAAEQARIVVAIEEALSKLEAGESGLRTVRQLLKRMRDAVLDAAVVGRLVPQRPGDRPAGEQLAELGVDVSPPLEPLPPGWCCARLGELVGPEGLFVDGDWVETKDQDPLGEVRLTQLADIGVGQWRNRSNRFMSTAAGERLGCTLLQKGDVLVARMPEPLGRACQFPGDVRPCVTVVDVAILRPDQRSVSPTWLMWAINSRVLRGQIEALKAGTTRKRISRKNLASVTLLVPPVEEQQRIATEIDRQFSFLEACERAVDTGLAQSAALRRAVLKSAFEGRLVPQDPTDEPASVLLERIRDERAATPEATSRRAGAKA